MLGAFWLNVQIFMVSEVFILVLALVIAVVRGIPGPVFFPFRLVAVAYTDLFRGVPLILVLYMIGFGVPGLGLGFISYLPDVAYGVISLVLVYSAYVAEVYRAGIDSVHESQNAAARSLGLTRWQSLRFVVLPQAIRRVIPPLLNDFIGLQKDTALVSVLGSIEAARAAQIYGASRVQLRELRGRRAAFRPDHHPPRPLYGPPDRPRQTPPRGGSPGMNEHPALLLEGVHKSFGENEVLKGIDLTVEPHEVVCLIGASGSGKSTLLRCVNLVEPIDSGRIVVEGEEITAQGVDANRIRRRIGIVYQSFNLFPHMTVLRNITLAPREVLKHGPRRGREERPTSSSTASGYWTSRTSTPTGSPAASSNGSPSCGRSRCAPTSCSSTRSRAPSTPSSSPTSSPSSRSSPAKA